MKITKNSNGLVSAVFMVVVVIAIVLSSLFIPGIVLSLVLNALGVKLGIWASTGIIFLIYFLMVVIKEIKG